MAIPLEKYLLHSGLPNLIHRHSNTLLVVKEYWVSAVCNYRLQPGITVLILIFTRGQK